MKVPHFSSGMNQIQLGGENVEIRVKRVAYPKRNVKLVTHRDFTPSLFHCNVANMHKQFGFSHVAVV